MKSALIALILGLLVIVPLNAQQGLTCDNPFVAVKGTNHTNNAGYTDQWFSYKATINGKITLSTCGLTTSDTYVTVYNACNTSAIAASDNNCSSQSMVAFICDSGVTYFINWEGFYTNGEYDWTLEEGVIVPGEFCSVASPAIAGTNHASHINGSDKWYSYTATRDGKITVSSCGLTTENTYVEVYTSCGSWNSGYNNNACSNQSKLSFASKTGTTYYIRWAGYYTTGEYDWTLVEEDPLPGEFCSSAISATAGTNHANHTGNINQWFSFTATRNGKIKVSTCGLTLENTYVMIYNSCDGWNYALNDNFCSNQSELSFEGTTGTTYYILWSNYYTSGEYDWTLVEEDPLPGEFCTTAIPAIADTNHADNSGNKNQWFSYTATKTGKIRVSSCNLTTENTYVMIYSGCDGWYMGSNDNYCSNQSEISFESNIGTTYYILWSNYYTSGEYDWRLVEEEPLPGESCISAIPVDEGTNHANNAGYSNQWFSYTATIDGIITITSCDLTTEDTYISVYNSCNGWEFESNNNYCGNNQSTVNFGCSAGTTYYICWRGYYTNGDYDWKLTEGEPQPGDLCSLPITAVVGTNHSDHSNGGDQWFSYTATIDGKITIASCELTSENTYVSVLSSCDGWDITSNNDYCGTQSKVTFECDSGTTYYILWRNYYTSSEYDWTLAEKEPQPGDFCSLPKTAIVGTNFADYSEGMYQWYSFTATRSGKITISTCGLTSEYTNAYVSTSCDWWNISANTKLCENQSTLSFESIEGTTYYILWINYYNNNGYDWTLAEEDIEEGDFCSFPISAIAGTNHTYHDNGNSQWYSYTATRDGKIVITSCDLTTVDTYVEVTNQCNSGTIANNNNYCGNQSRVSFESTSGTTYYIRWVNNNDNQGYDWTLAEEDPLPGEFCSIALPAIADTNYANHNNGLNQWFYYTATQNGKITVSSCDLTTENTYVRILTGCNGYSLISNDNFCGNQSKASIICDSGTTYYICWVSNNPASEYIWTLKEGALSPGEDCSLAIEATPGTIHASYVDMGYLWYAYTAPEDKWITISSCGLTEEDTYFAVYNSCDWNYVTSNDNYCSYQSETGLSAEAGQTYYIVWYNYNSNEDFDWSFSVEEPLPSLSCANAIEATVGLNQTTHPYGYDQWFYYRASEYGAITVSSCGNTTDDNYLEIYSGCNGNLIASNDNFCNNQAETSFDCLNSKIYYILWRNYSGARGYDWSIVEHKFNNADDITFDQNDGLLVYPNPNSGILTIQSENGKTYNNIHITNLNGQLLFSVNSPSLKQTIDVSFLSEGMYIVVADDGKSQQRQLIIIK